MEQKKDIYQKENDIQKTGNINDNIDNDKSSFQESIKPDIRTDIRTDIKIDTTNITVQNDNISSENLEKIFNNSLTSGLVEKHKKIKTLNSEIGVINGIMYKTLYINKETNEKKFTYVLEQTIKSGVLPLVKVMGDSATFKLVKCISTLNGLLSDKYNIYWKIFWTKDKGVKDDNEILVLNFLCLFKEISH